MIEVHADEFVTAADAVRAVELPDPLRGEVRKKEGDGPPTLGPGQALRGHQG
jgi:hypothetical protein